MQAHLPARDHGGMDPAPALLSLDLLEVRQVSPDRKSP
jgi:hypothetical protein